MSVNRIFIIIYATIILFLIGLGAVTFVMLNNQSDLTRSQEVRFESYLAADELRQSSRDLTRLARTYVVTGDSRYEELYWKVLDVRNGSAVRPDGRKIALADIMKGLGFTEDEFAKLEESERRSNELVYTETVAMNAVKGLYDDGNGNFTVRKEPDLEMARRIMFDDAYHSNAASIMEPINEFFALLENRTLGTVVGFEKRADVLLGIILGVIGLLIFISIIAYVIIRTRILRQIGGEPSVIAGMAEQIARGDLQISFDDGGKKATGIYAAFKNMAAMLMAKTKIIEAFADGDFSVEARALSTDDQLGEALEKMSDSLNDLLSQVNKAVDQVTIGSDQVSQASQSLSQGATEQASSLEEISASANQINGQSKQNAESANEANTLAEKAAADAEAGNTQMTELVAAMAQINASSDEINKVVKVIDDIAFQINLLALNANVEAARAGKYGKGFAVVAEEVRNLSVRATAAVQETSGMVGDSISNVKAGSRLVEITAKQLSDIVGGAGKVATFLDEIATASREQAQAIGQITNGLEQIDEVTQANTASAEQSASASEELASQGQYLKSMIARFRLKSEYNREPAYLVDNRDAEVARI